MALVLRNSKSSPLTNTELDNNFIDLSTRIDAKVSTTDYNSAGVLSRLVSGVMGANSGIDSSLLRGLQPLSTNTINSVVSRDSLGNFASNEITATKFKGKATDSEHADDADRAATLSSTLIISKGGTGATSAADARTNLGAVNKAGDTLTGRLTTLTSTAESASIRIPEGLAPSFPESGDVWSTSAGLYNKIGSSVKKIAYTDSSITGTSTNVTGVVEVVNGGTGANTPLFARTKLFAAKNGDNSDITSLSGLTTPLSTSQGGTGVSSPGNAGNILTSDGSKWISAYPNPSFQSFSNGIASPTPSGFPLRSIQGFDAYSSTDFPGAYFVGLTIKGISSQAAQLAMNWNSEETKPFGLYFRTNDDTSNTNAWSPWTTIWHERNMTPGAAGNILVSTGSAWSSVTPQSAGLSGYPPAAVVAFYRTTAPDGWLECNGQQVSRNSYMFLWEAMGFPNSGNGSSTFTIPDLRGEFVRGLDRGRGVDGGRTLGSSQADMFESHSHVLYGNDLGTNVGQLSAPGLYVDDAERAAEDLDTIKPTGGSETRPRNVALMYCIKY